MRHSKTIKDFTSHAKPAQGNMNISSAVTWSEGQNLPTTEAVADIFTLADRILKVATFKKTKNLRGV